VAACAGLVPGASVNLSSAAVPEAFGRTACATSGRRFCGAPVRINEPHRQAAADASRAQADTPVRPVQLPGLTEQLLPALRVHGRAYLQLAAERSRQHRAKRPRPYPLLLSGCWRLRAVVGPMRANVWGEPARRLSAFEPQRHRGELRKPSGRTLGLIHPGPRLYGQA